MTRFVILATPRTGSNWLCTLLDSHPDVLCHHEIFNPAGIHVALSKRDVDLGFGTVAERERDPLGLMDRVWRETLGHRAVGFKINRGQNPAALRRVLDDRTVRKIVVRRGNRLRTYVSERIAEATGEWESYPGQEIGAQRVTVTVDPEALRRHCAQNEDFYRSALAVLDRSAQPFHEVRYEDLGDPTRHRETLRFLQVCPDVALRGATRRQNPAPLEALIDNHDALTAALRGSDLERDLLADDAHQ